MDKRDRPPRCGYFVVRVCLIPDGNPISVVRDLPIPHGAGSADPALQCGYSVRQGTIAGDRPPRYGEKKRCAFP